MGDHLKPTPVTTHILEHVRDWKSWLMPLDDIKPIGGVTGMCFEGSASWYCYCRRSHVPIEWAHHVQSDVDTSPTDVMLLVKRYMADSDLSQPAVRLLHAGASWRLPQHPLTWMPRDSLSQEYLKGLNTLCDHLAQHFPEKVMTVANYFQRWVGTPLVAPVPPGPMVLLEHSYTDVANAGPPGLDIIVGEPEVRGPRVVGIQRKRRRVNSDNMDQMPLPSWVAYQRTCGVDEADAVAQWQGAQLLRR